MRIQRGKLLRPITVTLPEDLLHWLKIQAANADISMSMYLAKLLEREKKVEKNFDFDEKK
jgi:hypothetical protein